MKIEKSTYQGYLWYSDKQQPQFINNEFELEIHDSANPFIVEGLLFDGEKSICIRFIDGKYIIMTHYLTDLEGIEYTRQSLYAHPRLAKQGVSKLLFRQYWRVDDKDPLCENMEVLQPAELVFFGFEYENNKEA